MRITRGTRAIALLGLVLLASLALGAGAALAQTGQPTPTFTLQPNGTATITFEAFCTNFGQKFPQSVQAPNAVAPDRLRGALAYIQGNNISADQNKALEAQYAIWQLSGATGSPAGGADAQAVVAAANTAPANPQGTSLIDAAKAGQVSVTVASWQPIGAKVPIGAASDNFYGRGTLTVVNTTQQALTLYMPVGALLPPATAGEQTMAGYATSSQVNNPQPTPQPTAQSQPQQLPNTGAGDTNAGWLLFAGSLALIAAGATLHRQLYRRR
ncbi:MAG TPA: hypothetical protein PLO33_05925 [Kouleothrix sp.]|uniref:hypothetical protein n=1 Tax=Kouleothrix sp. TaxID=2779161 RepID=UPI002C6C9C3E|nr:hypothetical protein [Kouleothrix sp.]HRC75196.1 hypothetical protein [Kouleothrix sp.]